MAKRKLQDKLIKREQITEELKHIPKTNAYCTPSGNFYADYGDGLLYPLKTTINPKHHYKQVGLRYDGKNHNTVKRAHRLIAEMFVPNPNNYKIVGHYDNDKTNNCADNLYWTTVQENTQKAYDDGLNTNDKGWEDSQAQPVSVYDRRGNLIENCGSIGEAAIKYNISKHGIIYQCQNKPEKVRKKYIFRYLNDVL